MSGLVLFGGEGENFDPINLWFKYPIHYRDDKDELDDVPVKGSTASNLSKSSKRTAAQQRAEWLVGAFEKCNHDGVASVVDMAAQMGRTSNTVRRYLKEYPGLFDWNKEKGTVTRKHEAG